MMNYDIETWDKNNSFDQISTIWRAICICDEKYNENIRKARDKRLNAFELSQQVNENETQWYGWRMLKLLDIFWTIYFKPLACNNVDVKNMFKHKWNSTEKRLDPILFAKQISVFKSICSFVYYSTIYADKQHLFAECKQRQQKMHELNIACVACSKVKMIQLYQFQCVVNLNMRKSARALKLMHRGSFRGQIGWVTLNYVLSNCQTTNISNKSKQTEKKHNCKRILLFFDQNTSELQNANGNANWRKMRENEQ